MCDHFKNRSVGTLPGSATVAECRDKGRVAPTLRTKETVHRDQQLDAILSLRRHVRTASRAEMPVKAGPAPVPCRGENAGGPSDGWTASAKTLRAPLHAGQFWHAWNGNGAAAVILPM